MLEKKVEKKNTTLPFPVLPTGRHFIVEIKNIASSGGVDEKSDEFWRRMLIYNKAREQSPEAANALLQVQIACGLCRDR